MKHLVLTGIATELDVQSGTTSYSLVFNGGELHLPAQEAAVETVLAAMLGDAPTKAHFTTEEIESAREDMRAEEEEDEEDEDEDLASALSQQQWQSPNGQFRLDATDEGADIFSAQDDYSQPPAYEIAQQQAPDIDDGVDQL